MIYLQLFLGKVMKLSEPTEEVAGFYARMLDHDYTTKEVFNKNFFNDWKKVGCYCYTAIEFYIHLYHIWASFNLPIRKQFRELLPASFAIL